MKPYTTKVPVALGSHSYTITIDDGLLQHVDNWPMVLRSRRILIVTDTIVAPLYLTALQNGLTQRDCTHSALLLPTGESQKNFTTLQRILDYLMQERLARDGLIIALGGGVIGDISGFAAAIYQRGIDYLQVPTTLLAQVDSAVGGKTAINHPLGKNMIGAFHQPCAVLTDPSTLRSLPQRELIAGLAEVIKYGIIFNADFFSWLETHMTALRQGDLELLSTAIERSCRIKAAIVSRDEHERGERALLNLGHTFGHAIETGMGFGNWLHGEAVAAGMCAAARMSLFEERLDVDSVQRIENLITAAGLPTQIPSMLSPEQMLELMQSDKKVKRDRLYLVLINAIGHCENTAEYDVAALHRTLGNVLPRPGRD